MCRIMAAEVLEELFPLGWVMGPRQGDGEIPVRVGDGLLVLGS